MYIQISSSGADPWAVWTGICTWTMKICVCGSPLCFLYFCAAFFFSNLICANARRLVPPSESAWVLCCEPKACPHGGFCTDESGTEHTGPWGCTACWHHVGGQHRAMAAGLGLLFSKLPAGRYLLNEPCPGLVLVGTIASYQKGAWKWTNAYVSWIILGPGPKKELES